MADEELQLEDGGGKKSNMMLIIIIAVVLIGGGAAAYFFLFAGSDEPAAEQLAEGGGEAAAQTMTTSAPAGKAEIGTAIYVSIPQALDFMVPRAGGSDMTVQIKIQLLVRGSENEEIAMMHLPLIRGTLLQAFSATNGDDLVTEAGKVALREQALREVQKIMRDMAGSNVVEEVLFTGFVMQ